MPPQGVSNINLEVRAIVANVGIRRLSHGHSDWRIDKDKERTERLHVSYDELLKNDKHKPSDHTRVCYVIRNF
jgi:hypothetical protein